MRPRARAAAFALAALLPVARPQAGDGEAPQDSDLVERTGARLAQIEISVRGAPEAVTQLAPQDLALQVNFRKIREFALDRHCPGAPGATEPAAGGYGPGTFLFYFDQPHLTMAGRARAIDLARELVAGLVRDGAEVMLVSDARGLSIVHEPSRDLASLLGSLARLEHDRTQWDFFAEQEDDRVAEVIEILNAEEDVSRAISVARSYQRQEHVRADKSWRRLAVLVGRLATLAPPRAVLYFADTIRSNPGEHYLSFFGERLQRSSVALGGIATDALVGGLPFERVLDEASAHGVGVYAVLAQGLVVTLDHDLATSAAQDRTFAVAEPSRRRFRDAQDTLSSLAGETGGHAFLRGDTAQRIEARLREDRACFYVASFDPAGLPLDQPLRVVVESRRDDIRVQARGRIVLQSEEARLSSRLLGAFSLGRGDDLADLRSTLIPNAFGAGGYRVLLQIVVPPTSMAAAAWDIGASVVHREMVREEISGRVGVTQSAVAVVLEHELELPPGLHEIVSVAHEAGSDFVLSDHLRIELPQPGLDHAVAAPIVVLQPASAAFLRGEITRTRGSLGSADLAPLDPYRPTALVSLVCRSSREASVVGVERSLSGSSPVAFSPLEIDLGSDLCAQVRDLIPAGTLAPGAYRYELQVLQRGQEVHRAQRDLVVAAGQPPAGYDAAEPPEVDP